MTCIHGFDETNCPTCRMVKSSIPSTQDKINLLHENDLKPYNPLMEENTNNNEDILNNLTPNSTRFKLKSINTIPTANLLNPIPNFENKMFSERLGELNINKSDLFKISKKVPLESPELKLKKEE